MTPLPPRIRRKIRFEQTPGCLLSGPCWIWTGAQFQQRGGYGAVGYEGATWRVHRLTYTLLVGPVPDGLVLDHLCRQRLCCNPAHLEPVTQAVNLERGVTGRRKTRCVNGHALVGENLFIRQRKEGERWECRACIRANKRRRRAEARLAVAS